MNMAKSHDVFIHTKLLGGKIHRFFQKENDINPPLFNCLTTQEMFVAFNFISDQELLNKIIVEHTYDFVNEFSENKILLDGLFNPKIDGVDEKLKELVYSTLQEKYGDNPNPILTKRIEKELEIIIGKGYAVIY
jgi:DNA polymerase-3 subunit alpha (Gram-positive type)